ncbi:L,D-transpeptidase family protein [Hydrogenophaga sp.]|uniref:L,D-transpeptidase family protein n=1 Tax=Hydrogenophaga sp. TaxID=1904254 RepID=UPI0027335AF7|nr:L,D-transpeptidase family protein [Hydrogenophaga sp.]MDP3884196.1 L,D-transpeptidase family protein [Hydrogenophaga sp.]MDZ4360497.1 L,D-transpeptidase family protein [Variovorax sp.]
MAGRRYFQHGHASITTANLSSGIGSLLRPATVLAALAAMALALGLISSCVGPSAPTGGLLNRMASVVTADDPAGAPSAPSMLDNALSRVQDAAQLLGAPEVASGLQSSPLSGEALQQVMPLMGQAEAQLIEIYQLISQGLAREALTKADTLVRDHPNFHLAHLVHGDLLSLQTRPIRQLGDVPDTKALAAFEQLKTLREESRRRLRALMERPPAGSIPAQFLALSSQSRHAIAIDASRSRLYLFENQTPSASGNLIAQPPRLRLVGDFYISVGLSGIEKTVEGDKRTPLGVYYITSNLNPDNLPDLYGVGALPINYPNPLDVQRGKTGSGIWLHGTPREQFVRAPQASDGCVVLSNPDLERLLKTVQIRTTPVVIAPELQWVRPEALDTERQAFEAALEAWRVAKSEGNLGQLKGFYSSRFQNQGRDLGQWWPQVESELSPAKGSRELQLKEISLLRWRDAQDTMVVTFGEVPLGQSRGVTRRQYWALERDQWKIFSEGTL